MMEAGTNILPKQKTGGHTGVTSRRTAATRHEALQLFNACKMRLLNINSWKKICGDKGAEFWLTDEQGTLINDITPKIGNLIRIKLPAPENKTGDGFDWVRIETFENSKDLVKDEEVFGFRTRPVPNPNQKESESAHFYTGDATSTFLIIRNSATITVIERGRNEIPNIFGSFFAKLRNLVIAIPAMLGFSKPQWKMLADGILNPANNY